MAATIADVAMLAGVGVGTVSRVINGGKSVSEETQVAVQNAMKQLNYTPNSMAKRLRMNKSGMLALMIPVVYHPFFARLVDCVEQEAEKYGYSVLLVVSQQHVQREMDILEKIRKREIDGAVFVTHYVHGSEKLKDCPLVSIDRHLENVPFVTSNNYDATKESLEYLLQRGCKKIAFLGTKPLVDSEVSLRKQAYDDFVAEHGMENVATYREALHGNESMLCEEFLSQYKQVDGVFVSGYSVATQLCTLAQKQGIRIPDQLQVVAYDGTFQSWANGGVITCIEQPIEQMAHEAIKLLIDKIKGKATPEKVVFKSQFVVGTTTK